jgi:hypothetical protein
MGAGDAQEATVREAGKNRLGNAVNQETDPGAPRGLQGAHMRPARLSALGPAPRAELLHVLMLPDLERAPCRTGVSAPKSGMPPLKSRKCLPRGLVTASDPFTFSGELRRTAWPKIGRC